MGRKNSQRRYIAKYEDNSSNSTGAADYLHSVKRRRLSQNDENGVRPRISDHRSQQKAVDEDGWQIVHPKSSKHRKSRHRSLTDHRNASPRLKFHQKLAKPVLIEELRDLALYVLADGTAPSWVGVENSKKVGKVIVVMVPGFDHEILRRARELIERLRMQTKKQHSDVPNNEDHIENSNSLTKTDEVTETSHSPASISHSRLFEIDGVDLANFLHLSDPQYSDWLLDHDIPVRAPGDAKYHKVHSPLQAMLMVPQSSMKMSSKDSAAKQVKHTTTPISHFVHTADELREAEYPVHPATFTSTADAALEESRREHTRQSVAAGWVDSPVAESKPRVPTQSSVSKPNVLSQGLNIYAVDCEMVLTSDQKSSLARVSIVSWPDGKLVMDEYVKPDLPIENYFTQYSGITPQILKDVTVNLADIQERLVKILTPSTILLGHSLESDLNALKMTHPFIIDTSMLYPHPRGLPLRSSLKFLANKYLRREIQTGGHDGHDSVEDARAVLDLVKLKCERGPTFGTTEANGEPIFGRLSGRTLPNGQPLTSAIVEYGSSPERGLGRDATYAIGCQNDEEITAGTLRAVLGDEDSQTIPSGGATFVWSRLRALEFARGWVTTTSNAAGNTSGSNNKVGACNIGKKPDMDDQDKPAAAASAAATGHEKAGHAPPPHWKEEVELKTTAAAAQSARPTEEKASLQQTKHDDDDNLLSTIDQTILQTILRLNAIRDALPPSTLLMIYSGTSDVRPVIALQNIQAQYRREFKTKKWDELSVRWTDTEEQALRNAVEKAREGWGWIGVV